MTENQKVKAGENEEEDETEENADEYDPRTDPEYSKYLKGELKARAAKQDAECFEAERLWTPPPFPASLAEQLAEESPEITLGFQRSASRRERECSTRRRKPERPSSLMNKVRALVTGEPLFDWFEVNVRDDERAGYLNLELQRNQFNFEMKKMDLTSEAQKTNRDLSRNRLRAAGLPERSRGRMADFVAEKQRDRTPHHRSSQFDLCRKRMG